MTPLADYQTRGVAADLQVGDFVDFCGDGRRFSLRTVEAGVLAVDRAGSKLRLKFRFGTFLFRADCPVVYRREEAR